MDVIVSEEFTAYRYALMAFVPIELHTFFYDTEKIITYFSKYVLD